MVSKARDDFPDPDGPVKTTSRLRGISRSIPFRLCWRAPRMMIFSWLNGACPLTPYAQPAQPGPRPSVPAVELPQAREHIPQLLDLVPQLGGPLELQLLRRLVHLFLQLLDLAGQLFRPHGLGPAADPLGLLRLLPGLFLPGVLHDVSDLLPHGLRGDAVLPVVLQLDLPPPAGLLDGRPHGVGDLVGVEDHPAVDVPGRPADGLDEGGLGAEEALLV